MNSLLSTSDVAKLLNADETTVRLWCRQGLFANARQIGRGWIIPESDLVDFQKPKMGRPRKAKTKTATKAGKKGSGKNS
jgi:hypothetical protein